MLEAHRAIGILDKVKHPTHFVGDARIGGEQRIVGIEARGFLIEVAGADMGVAHHFVAFPARDQEQLGVNFQPRRGENNVHARFG